MQNKEMHFQSVNTHKSRHKTSRNTVLTKKENPKHQFNTCYLRLMKRRRRFTEMKRRKNLSRRRKKKFFRRLDKSDKKKAAANLVFHSGFRYCKYPYSSIYNNSLLYFLKLSKALVFTLM